MRNMDREEAMAFLAEGTRTGKLATASPAGTPATSSPESASSDADY